METFPQTIDRLLGALETLASAETVLLANQAWSELAVVQERSAAIVDRIVALMGKPLAGQPLDPAVFDRVRAITEDQGEKIAFLGRESAACAEELRLLNKSEQNVRGLLPAYRTPATSSPALTFAAQG